MGVSVATDGVVYESDVFSASHSHPVHHHHHAKIGWGGRAVLVLVGVRLGLDCVNPIYYDTIKVSARRNLSIEVIDRIYADFVHVPTVRWYLWWPSFFELLLRRFTSRQFVLPRSA
jgi:hypothetical protein